jgi:hypothetical protein
MSVEKIYKGILVEGNNTETEVLKLNDEILAETIESDIRENGNYLSVHYYISDEPVENPEEEFLKELYGMGEVTYCMAYSDITGYLWTDEDLIIGGHDLMEELRSNIGKYLHLVIEFNEHPKLPR